MNDQNNQKQSMFRYIDFYVISLILKIVFEDLQLLTMNLNFFKFFRFLKFTI